MLLPGLSLTLSIIELSTRNIISGTVRLFGAIFTATLIGYGMTIGSTIVAWPVADTVTCSAPSPLWGLLLFWPMATAVNLYFLPHRKQLPIMTFTAAVGWLAYVLLNQVPQLKSNTSATTAICALAIGLVANIFVNVFIGQSLITQGIASGGTIAIFMGCIPLVLQLQDSPIELPVLPFALAWGIFSVFSGFAVRTGRANISIRIRLVLLCASGMGLFFVFPHEIESLLNMTPSPALSTLFFGASLIVQNSVLCAQALPLDQLSAVAPSASRRDLVVAAVLPTFTLRVGWAVM
ncbi:hypothetical protein HK405_009090 [Cladochytrium tenue]|nr:hypothetical protein HK405_009090 [Cladochytrium tenue]